MRHRRQPSVRSARTAALARAASSAQGACASANLKSLSRSVASPNVTAPGEVFVYLSFTGHFGVQWGIGLTEPEAGGDKAVYFRSSQWRVVRHWH